MIFLMDKINGDSLKKEETETNDDSLNNDIMYFIRLFEYLPHRIVVQYMREYSFLCFQVTSGTKYYIFRNTREVHFDYKKERESLQLYYTTTVKGLLLLNCNLIERSCIKGNL